MFEDGIGHGIWTFVRLWAPSPFKKADHSASEDDGKKDKILSLFQLQESKLLNQGTDKAEQLRQLHERILVLRGAVFSGFVLSLICLFAYFAPAYGHPAHRIRAVFVTVRSIWFALFALLNGWQDLLNHVIFDIPGLEGLIATIFSISANLVFSVHKSHLLPL